MAASDGPQNASLARLPPRALRHAEEQKRNERRNHLDHRLVTPVLLIFAQLSFICPVLDPGGR
jgi:hypothetical protein